MKAKAALERPAAIRKIPAWLLLQGLVLLPSSGWSQGPIRHAVTIHHVFIIVLENKNFDDTFSRSSAAPYLAETLRARGVLLEQYYGIGHASLDNYIAMISGQAATPETRADCDTFAELTLERMDPDGQAVGRGCVYPTVVKTLSDQLVASGKTWRAYMEDMGLDPYRENATCGHPPLNQRDNTQEAEPPSSQHPRGDEYATRHNPFVYFHSIIDSPACARSVVSLNRLEHDLASLRRTPNLVFLSPNLCHDGHDAPCKTGEPGGLMSADQFLRTWVPRIERSAAYKQDGLLIVTFDEGDAQLQSGGDSTFLKFKGEKCCDQQPGPNLAPFPQVAQDDNTTVRFEDYGGERTGTILLSPFLRAGTVSKTPFNHYSLLKTLEDLMGLREHLGYAGQPGLIGFFESPGSDVPSLEPRRGQ